MHMNSVKERAAIDSGVTRRIHATPRLANAQAAPCPVSAHLLISKPGTAGDKSNTSSSNESHQNMNSHITHHSSPSPQPLSPATGERGRGEGALITPQRGTCRLLTLGCKVNQYETQYVKEMLEANGYREAKPDEQADLCVVNTCTVTMEGDAKSRQLIRRLATTNPEAAIVVMGCYATRDPDAVGKLPGVTKVVIDKGRLADDLQMFGVTQVPPGISRFDGHQRAFVKVQDGCLLNCAYCIIPSVRPHLCSRPPEEIVEEVARLVDGGCREIVLTGIHLGHYGIDLSRGKSKSEWRRLWHLLERLCRLPGDFRIRLSSLEAAEVRDDLVRVLANEPRICPHLHLCLQSGSDRVLAMMKRRYRSAGFLERCRRLKETLDQPAFTTDVIVGFPGETDTDFEETCRVARAVGFSRDAHLFLQPTAGHGGGEFAEHGAGGAGGRAPSSACWNWSAN